MLSRLAKEFCIEPRTPLYVDFLDACKKRRKCVNSWCKNKLKLKGFLEMNLDAENYEIDTILARAQEKKRHDFFGWVDFFIMRTNDCFSPSKLLNIMYL